MPQEYLEFEKPIADLEKKIEELTLYALEVCAGKFLVGYTDLHPGLDCVAAWRDPQQLCFDMIDNSATRITAIISRFMSEKFGIVMGLGNESADYPISTTSFSFVEQLICFGD